jgi:ssDNA-binding Zn-finger/Zn-ribbon topoisomerase 1
MFLSDLNEMDQEEPLVGASVHRPGDRCMCGKGILVEREAVITKDKFVGCSRFPKCRISHAL